MTYGRLNNRQTTMYSDSTIVLIELDEVYVLYLSR